eukprot:gene11370-12701_t
MFALEHSTQSSSSVPVVAAEDVVKTLIQKLKAVGPAQAARKNGEISLESLKLIAASMNIRKDIKKSDLVERIFARLNEQEEEAAVEIQSFAFKKDDNTVPRILNIMTRHRNLSQQTLVFQAGGHHHAVFAEVAEEFNSSTVNSGGLCVEAQTNPLIQQWNIDPEHRPANPITAVLVHKYFTSTLNEYRKAYANYYFFLSRTTTTKKKKNNNNNDDDGEQEEEDDFWDFCWGNKDIFYLHLLINSNPPDDDDNDNEAAVWWMRFCREDVAGFDTGRKKNKRQREECDDDTVSSSSGGSCGYELGGSAGSVSTPPVAVTAAAEGGGDVQASSDSNRRGGKKKSQEIFLVSAINKIVRTLRNMSDEDDPNNKLIAAIAAARNQESLIQETIERITKTRKSMESEHDKFLRDILSEEVDRLIAVLKVQREKSKQTSRSYLNN